MKVLFLCTHNSSRSQMAEALLNYLAPQGFMAFSAGTSPTFVHPLAIRILKEIGIDISHARSKSMAEFEGKDLDYVITLCDDAAQNCPVWPGSGERIHWGLPDPSLAQGKEEERLRPMRGVRNEIKERLIAFASLSKETARLRCPHCGYIEEITVPENTCLFFHQCINCKKIMKPFPEMCCVVCSYSDKTCHSFKA